MRPKLIIFILGVIAGLLIAFFVPPLVQGWLPEGMTGAKSATNGVVVAKRLEDDRLLLTIESADGAVLATFKQKVPEIDLLIDTGDDVTLGITSYEPFVDDPKILGVKKAKAPKPSEGGMQPAAPGAEAGHPMGADAANGSAAAPGEEPTAEGGSDDVTLPPMGPPLEDEQKTPGTGTKGGDGSGSHPG